jgi:hypothetical protein
MSTRPRDELEIDSYEVNPIDWRVRVLTRLASDFPSAYPGGPSHRAGALVVQETPGRDATGKNVGFITPSAIALALSLAMKAAENARILRQQVEESEVVSPFGPSSSVTPESTPALYDYLEQCMTAVTFSFQALEAYCNETISDKLTGTFALSRDKGRRRLELSADELERVASTEEKLGVILPDLLGIPNPKGRRVWQDFVALKEARDATMHIKSRDSAPRIMQPSDLDERTLFHRFLGADVMAWPRAAVAMILYFATVSGVPPYVVHARKALGVQAKGPSLNQSKSTQLPRGARRSATVHAIDWSPNLSESAQGN